MNFLWACATCCWNVFPIDLMWGFHDSQGNWARFLVIMTSEKKQHKKTNHASTAVLGFLWWWDEHLTACFWCWCGSPLCASLPFHHEAQLHITMHEYILRMRIIDPHGGELYIHLLYSIRRSEVRIRGSSWKSSVFFKDILLRILSFTIRKLHKWRYFSTDVSTEILNLIFATL